MCKGNKYYIIKECFLVKIFAICSLFRTFADVFDKYEGKASV